MNDDEKHLWWLRKKKEANLTGDPGRSLIEEIRDLKVLVLELCKKLEVPIP